MGILWAYTGAIGPIGLQVRIFQTSQEISPPYACVQYGFYPFFHLNWVVEHTSWAVVL